MSDVALFMGKFLIVREKSSITMVNLSTRADTMKFSVESVSCFSCFWMAHLLIGPFLIETCCRLSRVLVRSLC